MEVGVDTVLLSILKNYLHIMIVVHNKTDDTTTQCGLSPACRDTDSTIHYDHRG